MALKAGVLDTSHAPRPLYLGKGDGEEGNGHPLQDSWGNPMDREAWRATAHGGPKNWTRLSDKTTITNATGTSINKPFTILKSASWHKIEFVEIPIFVGQNLEQLQTQAWLV